MGILELFDKLDPEMQRLVLELLQRLYAIQISEVEALEKFEALKRRVVGTELNH